MAGRSTARLWLLSGLVFIIAVGAGAYFALQTVEPPADPPRAALPPPEPRPRRPFDSSGNIPVTEAMERWPAAAPLKDVARCWEGAPGRLKARLDAQLAHPRLLPGERISALIALASWHHFHGHPDQAYAVLGEARALAEATPADSANWRATVVYYQGLTGLRRGETENCVMCRGESSCILPLAPAALHTNPAGSRLAIKHFTEYLEMFPDDFQVRWLLNLAHMTLGEHPSGVDPRFVIRLDGWAKSEFDIGRFRDIGADVGINRFNEAGATVLDDFDNDGLFDILFTAYNAARPIVLYKNLGNGKFADVTEKANLRGNSASWGRTGRLRQRRAPRLLPTARGLAAQPDPPEPDAQQRRRHVRRRDREGRPAGLAEFGHRGVGRLRQRRVRRSVRRMRTAAVPTVPQQGKRDVRGRER